MFEAQLGMLFILIKIIYHNTTYVILVEMTPSSTEQQPAQKPRLPRNPLLHSSLKCNPQCEIAQPASGWMAVYIAESPSIKQQFCN